MMYLKIMNIKLSLLKKLIKEEVENYVPENWGEMGWYEWLSLFETEMHKRNYFSLTDLPAFDLVKDADDRSKLNEYINDMFKQNYKPEEAVAELEDVYFLIKKTKN